MQKMLMFAALLLMKCDANKAVKSSCFRDFVNHGKFVYKYKLSDSKDNYLLFNDSLHEEVVDGVLTTVDSMVWTSCSEYLLIKKRKSDFWEPGEILKVNISKRIRDTLFITASAKGKSFSTQLVKIR